MLRLSLGLSDVQKCVLSVRRKLPMLVTFYLYRFYIYLGGALAELLPHVDHRDARRSHEQRNAKLVAPKGGIVKQVRRVAQFPHDALAVVRVEIVHDVEFAAETVLAWVHYVDNPINVIR